MIEFVFIFQYYLIDKPMVISWEFPHRSALNPQEFVCITDSGDSFPVLVCARFELNFAVQV